MSGAEICQGCYTAERKPSRAVHVIWAKRFWAREDMSTGGNVDLEVMRPLAQLGQSRYGRVGDTFKLPRPKLK